MIISGFPGIGKSTYAKMCGHRYKILDLDSSKYPKDDTFPNEYINDIKKYQNEYDIIFVSTHLIVRIALSNNNIPHYVIIPDISCEYEYNRRFQSRSQPIPKIHWDLYLNEILYNKQLLTSPEHLIILHKNEYVGTGIYKIKCKEKTATVLDAILSNTHYRHRIYHPYESGCEFYGNEITGIHEGYKEEYRLGNSDKYVYESIYGPIDIYLTENICNENE